MLWAAKKSQRVLPISFSTSGLQLAVGAGYNAVGASGVETDAGLAILITAHRKLNLIAVAVDLGRGEGRQHGYIQPANAAESIGNASRRLARSSAA